MKIIGLTGGIGSGKSTVAAMFENRGVPVYYSDKEAKRLMVTSKKLKEAIQKNFGIDSYLDGELNRKYLADQVFKNKKKLSLINSLVHPVVEEHFGAWVKRQRSDYVIQENPLIFEKGIQYKYDATILVTAPLETRVDRVIQRDETDRNAVLQRIENQMSDQEKLQGADYVIQNLDLKETAKQVNLIHSQLIG